MSRICFCHFIGTIDTLALHEKIDSVSEASVFFELLGHLHFLSIKCLLCPKWWKFRDETDRFSLRGNLLVLVTIFLSSAARHCGISADFTGVNKELSRPAGRQEIGSVESKGTGVHLFLSRFSERCTMCTAFPLGQKGKLQLLYFFCKNRQLFILKPHKLL